LTSHLPPPPLSTPFPYTTLFRSILAHEKFNPLTGKTGVCLLRYRRGDIVGVVDRAKAGRDAGEVLPEARGVPIFASVQDALQTEDRKSTRLNSSHQIISYAVFCL